jgi:uncharacterized SAM-binding protein YcdF (DUF218 family)
LFDHFDRGGSMMLGMKKFLTPLFYPLGLALVLLTVGLLLLWCSRWQRAGRTLATVALLVLLVGGCDGVARSLVLSLEDRYPSLSAQALLSDTIASVRWIVVLGGGNNPDPDLPQTAQLERASLARLLEGIRLHRALPASRLILSGGAVYTSVPEAEAMAEVAELLGVDKTHLVLEVESRDTGEQARVTAGRFRNEPFLLVTSASHMPRAMALFEKQGLSPIPAPTDYLAFRGAEVHPGRFWPNAWNLYLTQVAVHEYFGFAYSWMTGQI